MLASSADQVQIDAVLASGKTTTLWLSYPMPVYIAVFAVDVVEYGMVRFHADYFGYCDAAIGQE